MIAPLRWVYPQSYKSLKAKAEEAGIHPCEYQALVDMGTAVGHTVILQCSLGEWNQVFTPEALTIGSEMVSSFFAKAVQEIAEAVKAASLLSMHQRRV